MDLGLVTASDNGVIKVQQSSHHGTDLQMALQPYLALPVHPSAPLQEAGSMPEARIFSRKWKKEIQLHESKTIQSKKYKGSTWGKQSPRAEEERITEITANKEHS